MAEVNEMMFQAFNLAKEVCVHISSQERQKNSRRGGVILFLPRFKIQRSPRKIGQFNIFGHISRSNQDRHHQ